MITIDDNWMNDYGVRNNNNNNNNNPKYLFSSYEIAVIVTNTTASKHDIALDHDMEYVVEIIDANVNNNINSIIVIIFIVERRNHNPHHSPITMYH